MATAQYPTINNPKANREKLFFTHSAPFFFILKINPASPASMRI